MDGMQAGYAARSDHERALQDPAAAGAPSQRLRLPPLGRRDFLWMSAVGDLGDLKEAFAAPEDKAAGKAGWGRALGCSRAPATRPCRSCC